MHLIPQWLRLFSVLRRCSVVVDSLFIVALIVCGGSVFGLCLGMQYLVYLLFFATILMSCFILIVFLVSCDCLCSVLLPHDAVGWYVVCDYGIF